MPLCLMSEETAFIDQRRSPLVKIDLDCLGEDNNSAAATAPSELECVGMMLSSLSFGDAGAAYRPRTDGWNKNDSYIYDDRGVRKELFLQRGQTQANSGGP